ARPHVPHLRPPRHRAHLRLRRRGGLLAALQQRAVPVQDPPARAAHRRAQRSLRPARDPAAGRSGALALARGGVSRRGRPCGLPGWWRRRPLVGGAARGGLPRALPSGARVMNLRNPLRRSRRHRMIAGVCGGIAEWLGWDPTLVRVLYVVGSIVSAAFPGILVYLLLWIIVPNAEE